MTSFCDLSALASTSGFSDPTVPVVAIIFGVGFLIVKTIMKTVVEVNARKYDRAQAAAGKGAGAGTSSDVSAIRQMQQTLTKMEERVEALETILIEHTRSQKL